MRKVVITLETDLMSNLVPNSFFEAIEYIEGKAILKVNLEIGVKIAVCDIKTNPGFTLEDIEFPDEWAILDVLKKTDNIYTILLKTEYRNGTKFQQLYNEEYFKKIRNLLEMDIIFDLPFILTEKELVMAFSVNNEILKEFLDTISILGDIKNISFQPAAFSDSAILSCLTERQKEVITVAKKSGYYDVPRKVNAEELSKKLGVSRATITEHLRKAEQRIIKNILAGY
jgi:predicted DNA binding protein